jgi:hypothetical protein
MLHMGTPGAVLNVRMVLKLTQGVRNRRLNARSSANSLGEFWIRYGTWKFRDFSVMVTKIQVLWDMEHCRSINTYQLFGENNWLHFQGSREYLDKYLTTQKTSLCQSIWMITNWHVFTGHFNSDLWCNTSCYQLKRSSYLSSRSGAVGPWKAQVPSELFIE